MSFISNKLVISKADGQYFHNSQVLIRILVHKATKDDLKCCLMSYAMQKYAFNIEKCDIHLEYEAKYVKYVKVVIFH